MNGQTTITLVGNLTNDPELRYSPAGNAVANFQVASTPRTFDKGSQEWKDGETLFMRCSVWRDEAEHVAESLTRGARVIVTGRLRSRTYQTKEGESRTVVELDVDEIGPSLRYATAKVSKVAQRERQAPAPEGDAWATAQGAVRSGLGGRPVSHDEEPPF